MAATVAPVQRDPARPWCAVPVSGTHRPGGGTAGDRYVALWSPCTLPSATDDLVQPGSLRRGPRCCVSEGQRPVAVMLGAVTARQLELLSQCPQSRLLPGGSFVPCTQAPGVTRGATQWSSPPGGHLRGHRCCCGSDNSEHSAKAIGSRTRQEQGG